MPKAKRDLLQDHGISESEVILLLSMIIMDSSDPLTEEEHDLIINERSK
jgi:hypothetical protein